MIGLAIMLACAPEVDATAYRGVFAALDTDHDGRVSATEYTGAAPPVAPAFTAADLDGDGALQLEEMAALAHHIDPANFDPSLVPSKFDSRRQNGKPSKRGRADKPAGGGAAPAASAVQSPGTGFDGSGPPLIGGSDDPGLVALNAKHPPGTPHLKDAADGGPTVGNTDAEGHETELFREAVQFEAAEVRARDPEAALPSDTELRDALHTRAGSDERRALIARLRAEVERVGLSWPNSFVP